MRSASRRQSRTTSWATRSMAIRCRRGRDGRAAEAEARGCREGGGGACGVGRRTNEAARRRAPSPPRGERRGKSAAEANRGGGGQSGGRGGDKCGRKGAELEKERDWRGLESASGAALRSSTAVRSTREEHQGRSRRERDACSLAAQAWSATRRRRRLVLPRGARANWRQHRTGHLQQRRAEREGRGGRRGARADRALEESEKLRARALEASQTTVAAARRAELAGRGGKARDDRHRLRRDEGGGGGRRPAVTRATRTRGRTRRQRQRGIERDARGAQGERRGGRRSRAETEALRSKVVRRRPSSVRRRRDEKARETCLSGGSGRTSSRVRARGRRPPESVKVRRRRGGTQRRGWGDDGGNGGLWHRWRREGGSSLVAARAKGSGSVKFRCGRGSRRLLVCLHMAMVLRHDVGRLAEARPCWTVSEIARSAGRRGGDERSCRRS